MSVLIDADCCDDSYIARIVEQRCRTYREQFALEAFRVPGHDHIVGATGPTLAAVVAPRPMAATAYRLLETAVPVFAVGGDRWVFISEGPTDSVVAQRLSLSSYRLPIVLILAPTPLALPTPGLRMRSWLHLPDGSARPPITTVVAALQAAVEDLLLA
ncbi:hypothetical protein IU433_22175 [Nocardia puris]|uniref:hypothetical protein n=1 Tax=Nocardia TaxID=1817 RepID=UPI0011DD915E|nr:MULTISPECIES: hypothetical protein [Nocardia]MBF6137227.1 hypothetical protein [Nocardia otitidiscaviarum]MBF6181831.1 hypothetical protein [Nocardia otitidiscaviarum]MBF6461724.1 hypothetical protein [Nocardia puris]MBF6488125.1 hypothetical protein [Nocardia otitidiscaviarum]